MWIWIVCHGWSRGRSPVSDTENLSRHLGVGLRQRLRRIRSLVARRLYMRYWFPHVPLFLAVAVLGFIQVVPEVRNALGLNLTWTDFLAATRVVMVAVIHGAPKVVAGVFLLIMSLGLLTRSRLAWTITVLATSVSLILFLLSHTGEAGTALIVYNAVLLLALLLGYRHFQRSSLASATLFMLTSIVSLLAYAVVGAFVLGQQFTPHIGDFVTAFYFAVVTMTTVGYGDIAPQTPEARLFVVSIILLGITVFATSLSALLVPLLSRRVQALMGHRDGTMERSNHYVIVGDTALARNSYKELKARNQAVTFILRRAPEDEGEDFDVVVGDASNLDVLQRAGGDRAKAILALDDDDSENAFVVLAAKELAENVKTVAVVNDSRNIARIKRVHPDLIIAPQVLGGELLAMALSGEALDSERLMDQLLHFGS